MPNETGSTDDRGKTVVRNASWLMLSQLFTWSLSTAEAFVIPRRFGPEVTGNLHVALSLWAIVALVVGFGTDLTLNRMIASGARNIGELVGSVLVMRVLLHGVGFAALLIYSRVVGYSTQVVALVLIFGIAGLFGQIANVFDSVLYGLQEITRSVRIGIAARTIETTLIISLVFAGFAFEQVMLAAIVGAVLSAVLQYWVLRRSRPLQLRPKVNVAVGVLREAAPIFTNRLARDLYVQLDVVILSLIATEAVVGWYAVSDVLFGTLLFIPTVFGTAVFPAIAKSHAEDPGSAAALTRRSLHLLLVAVVPLGLGVTVIGHTAITLLYGDRFEPGGQVFQVFGVVIILTSLNTLVGQHLIAIRREKKLTVLMFMVFVVAVPLDLALIRWTQTNYGNGALGAVTAYVVTETLMLVGGIRLLPKGTLEAWTYRMGGRVLLAGGLMLLALWPLRNAMPLIPIGLGVVLYGLLVLALRLLPVEDRQLIRTLVTRRS